MMRIVCPVCGDEPKKGQRHVCAAAQAAPAPPFAEAVSEHEQQLPRREESASSGVGVLQRRGLKATPNAVCASIASLVSKSHNGLWRSTSALARCGGEVFVAGLLATTVGSVAWAKDPKGALISALTGRIADEAARAIQDCWRRKFRAPAPRRPPVKRDGFQQLALAAPRVAVAASSPMPAHFGAGPQRVPQAPRSMQPGSRTSSRGSERVGQGPRARPPPLSVVLPRNEDAEVTTWTSELLPAASQSPSGTGSTTPRNKSNPRPSGARGVPTNPIQALKQRRAQQEKEVEERRLQHLQEAEEWRARRGASSGSVPASPQGCKALTLVSPMAEESVPSSADTEAFDCARMLGGLPASGPSTPGGGFNPWNAGGNAEPDFCHETCPGVSASAVAAALTPLEHRSARQGLQSPRGAAATKPPLPASFGGGWNSATAQGAPTRGEGESRSAPTTLQHWRPEAACEAPRASSANGFPMSSPKGCPPVIPSGEPTATARLRERMRQREGSSAAPRAKSPSLGPTSSNGGGGGGASGWQDRIEARQREVDEQQEIEAQQKQLTEERSSRRNSALRKVMERQAQRQEAVEGLEEH